MITYRQIDPTRLSEYDAIPMRFTAKSEFKIIKQNRGLGGFSLEESLVTPYEKDFNLYGKISDDAKHFDVTSWAFFLAFDEEKTIGGATVVTRTKEVNMLEDRDDLAVLWDLRVDGAYKRQGVGKALFDLAKTWAKEQGMKQLKIECQNNNVAACKFYHAQGAILGAIIENAYKEPDCKDEAQLLWYLDL